MDASGNKVGALVSEGITLQTCSGGGQGNVPEPTAITLLRTILVLVSLKLRKKMVRP